MKLNNKKLTSTSIYSIADARRSNPPYAGTRNVNEFLSMTLGERAFIARYMVSSFTPTEAIEPSDEFKNKYSKEWFVDKAMYQNGDKKHIGDVAHFILNACVFPKRSQEDWTEPKYEQIDFYENVTCINAINWYYSCPEFIQKRINQLIETYPEIDASKSGEVLYDSTKRYWGDRPSIEYEDDPNFGKGLVSHYIELELYNQWCYEYEREAIKMASIKLAPEIQEERRLLSKAMGVDNTGLPNQAEGLDPVQSATIAWIQNSGETPLEILAKIARDPEAKLSDRISAASKLMDYVHRRVPVKQEVDTNIVTTPKLDPKILKALNTKELDLLEKLLGKLG